MNIVTWARKQTKPQTGCPHRTGAPTGDPQWKTASTTRELQCASQDDTASCPGGGAVWTPQSDASLSRSHDTGCGQQRNCMHNLLCTSTTLRKTKHENTPLPRQARKGPREGPTWPRSTTSGCNARDCVLATQLAHHKHKTDPAKSRRRFEPG
eukprot:CAMPEP_0204310370 /NCGR_PEP_ID=MMETSP0469-20131031/1674_1 /ASSEMBLY_ACC=CAM_ASM_000384 /TAXON_ID=2969 /ORGANISM="Oxyrrhis marina" /LENGTH=152 /DNA_ID=CAMNT_0051290135 /DNA_START=112 /DNA_END=566 /DNA_ORIENTATION=-